MKRQTGISKKPHFTFLATAVLLLFTHFTFSSYAAGATSTLWLNIESLNPATGEIVVNGIDTQFPAEPFTWDWGDGSAPEDGWFPMTHTYSDTTQNYIIAVTSHYSGGETDSAQMRARFIVAQYSGGSGATEDPYQIANTDDLLTLAANTDDYDKCFVLTNDIDLNPYLSARSVGFIPVPGFPTIFTTAVIAPDTDNSNPYFDGIPFTGVFDGAGHTIYNLTINTNGSKSDYLGLFGCVGGFTEMGGVIKNLTLQNVNISAGPYSERVAALVGENDAGIITNCFSAGSIRGKDNSIYIGGLIGMDVAGNISFCSSSCNIIGEINTSMLGGLVGDAFESRISDCSTTGLISGASDCWYLGGLVGYSTSCNIAESYSTVYITTSSRPYACGGLIGACYQSVVAECFASGDVFGVSESFGLGGLVGENAEFSAISQCYATGNVSGGEFSDSIGGLIGYNTANCTNCFATGNVATGFGPWAIGGLVGSNDAFDGEEIGNISKCYSRGTVTIAQFPDDPPGSEDDSGIGGLVGQKYAGTVADCYFLAAAGPDNGFGIPLSDKQMRRQNSFVNWDFVNESANGNDDVWSIIEGIDYPRLAGILESIDNYPLLPIDVDKCTVKAGKKPNTDKISISGQLRFKATHTDFGSAGCVKVIIDSEAMVEPCVKAFINDGKTLTSRKFNSSATGSAPQSFKYDFKTGKFTFTADKTDLTGLACPFVFRIEIGNYIGYADIDEIIVNGPKKLIPINLLMGAKDSFTVEKFKVKNGKYLYSDQLSIKGRFSVLDTTVNMAKHNFVLTLGQQTFTLKAGTFQPDGINFVCLKRGVAEGGIASAVFDFDKCAFSLNIKNAWVNSTPGPVDLNINFASFDTQSVQVNLP